MPSENYSDFGGSADVLASLIDNKLLSEDTVIDKLSLSFEILMILLFILSTVYAINKERNRYRPSLSDDIELQDVRSLLRNVTKQRKSHNFPDQHDSAVCNSAATADESERRMGSGDVGIQLPGIVVQHKRQSMVQSERI
jgi:hypothetical protein